MPASTPPAWTAARRGEVRLPRPLAQVLDRFLAERFPRAEPKRLRAEIALLSDAFTEGREDLPISYLNRPPSRSAYLAFFHPQQVLRGIAALEEVRVRARARGLWPTQRAAAAPTSGPVRVLDLGAGLGAMSQALLAVEDDRAAAFEFTFVDHQKAALADARDLLLLAHEALRPGVPAPRVRTATAQIERWIERALAEGWRYDVVLLGGVWNEIRGPWEPLQEKILSVLDPAAPGGGMCVAVEPALPETGRRLQALRDDFLEATTTIAPCTHARDCPLAKLSRDWCFSVRLAYLPAFVRQVAAQLGHQKGEVRYAFWACTAQPGAAAPEVEEANQGRIVSDPVPGGQVVCVAGERERVPEAGPAFLRGDLVSRKPPA